jgi:hypothetical protein
MLVGLWVATLACVQPGSTEGDDGRDGRDARPPDGEGGDPADFADEAAGEASVPDLGPQTCDIDFLFIVDTSASMLDAMETLATEAFPNFVRELEAYPSLGTYRVAVKSQLYGERTASGGVLVDDSLFLTAGWPPGLPHEDSGGMPLCTEVPSAECHYASGERWMEGPSASLAAEFACVGHVACRGDDALGEPSIRAGLEALGHRGSAGFLRSGALLVVVILTDEDDQSDCDPDTGLCETPIGEFRERYLALKGGDERFVALLALGGPRTGTPIGPGIACMSPAYGEFSFAPRLWAFADAFGSRGRAYDLCTQDISSALTSAIDTLELSCDVII